MQHEGMLGFNHADHFAVGWGIVIVNGAIIAVNRHVVELELLEELRLVRIRLGVAVHELRGAELVRGQEGERLQEYACRRPGGEEPNVDVFDLDVEVLDYSADQSFCKGCL